MVNKKLFLAICFIIALLVLASCYNTTPNDTVSTDTGIIDTLPNETDTIIDTDKITDTSQGYFVATVAKSEYFIATPYTDGKDVANDLKGVFYSADAPGGNPRNDGTGKITTCKNCIKIKIITA